MIISEKTNSKKKSPDCEGGKFIDIELIRFNQQKFTAFIAACKTSGISAREAIENFLTIT